jgi:hypothetical protein
MNSAFMVEVDQLRQQLKRKVVGAENPQIFERVQSDTLPRAGKTSNDNAVKALRHRKLAGGFFAGHLLNELSVEVLSGLNSVLFQPFVQGRYFEEAPPRSAPAAAAI